MACSSYSKRFSAVLDQLRACTCTSHCNSLCLQVDQVQVQVQVQMQAWMPAEPLSRVVEPWAHQSPALICTLVHLYTCASAQCQRRGPRACAMSPCDVPFRRCAVAGACQQGGTRGPGATLCRWLGPLLRQEQKEAAHAWHGTWDMGHGIVCVVPCLSERPPLP